MVRFRLPAIVGVFVVSLVLAFPASASPPTVGTGTGLITSVSIVPIRTAGGNVTQERDLGGEIHGTLDGTFAEHVVGVIHGTSLLTFQGTMTFTGTVGECGSGTVTLGVTGHRDAGAPVSESSATVRVIDAASNTIAVHGVGTVDQSGPVLTYQVQYSCQ